MRKVQRVDGLMLAKMKYVMEIFGTDMLAAELLIGPPLSSFYTACFMTHFLLRNVKRMYGLYMCVWDLNVPFSPFILFVQHHYSHKSTNNVTNPLISLANPFRDSYVLFLLAYFYWHEFHHPR